MSNRPFLIILVVMVLAIGVAWVASVSHPGGDPPPAEKDAEEQQQKMDQEKKEHEARHAKVDHSADAFDKVKEGAVQITMDIDQRGKIVMELYPKAAPQTVAHITDLVKQKFYDGIKIHRVDSSPAVVQFGDPNSKNVPLEQFPSAQIGTHGSGKMVPLEVLLPHKKYTIGMARSQDLNSGDSQMYINTEDNSGLDGEYCIFGRIIQGTEVVPTIKKGDVIKSITLN